MRMEYLSQQKLSCGHGTLLNALQNLYPTQPSMDICLMFQSRYMQITLEKLRIYDEMWTGDWWWEVQVCFY